MENLSKISLITFIVISINACTKEKNSDFSKAEKNSIKNETINTSSNNGLLVEESRNYVWNGDKLECPNAGSGCIVNTKYTTSNGEINVSVLQVLKYCISVNIHKLKKVIIFAAYNL